MDEQRAGVIEKYTVKRNGDTSGKHDVCWFFVLDIKHDPLAETALIAYAEAAKAAGYQALRDDLYDRVMEQQVERRRARSNTQLRPGGHT